MSKTTRRSPVALAWIVCTAAAHAAGGHFDVDDAGVAEPGHCQYETWLTRAPSPSATLFRLGPACRVGPVELGLNFDRVATAADTRSALGAQLKWSAADPLLGTLGAGAVWSIAHDLKHGGRPTHVLYLPFTWTVSDRLAVNANLGADWDVAGARTRRIGVSASRASGSRTSSSP